MSVLKTDICKKLTKETVLIKIKWTKKRDNRRKGSSHIRIKLKKETKERRENEKWTNNKK